MKCFILFALGLAICLSLCFAHRKREAQCEAEHAALRLPFRTAPAMVDCEPYTADITVQCNSTVYGLCVAGTENSQ